MTSEVESYESADRAQAPGHAEGYVSGWSNGPEPWITTYENPRLLNASVKDAHVEITVFFRIGSLCGPTALWFQPGARCM